MIILKLDNLIFMFYVTHFMYFYIISFVYVKHTFKFVFTYYIPNHFYIFTKYFINTMQLTLIHYNI